MKQTLRQFRSELMGIVRIVGLMASVMSGVMAALYLIPGTSCSLIWQEWVIVGGWMLLGGVFLAVSRRYYGSRFASGV